MSRKHARTHNKGPFSCEFCDTVFNFKSGLDLHLKQHKTSNEPTEETKNISKKIISRHYFVEEIFLEEIPSEETIIEGVSKQNSEKLIICDICGTLFTTKYHMVRHIARKHREKMNFNYACHLCSKRFFLKYEVQRHMVKHDEGRPFQCVHCEKRFKTKSNLASHIKSVHNRAEIKSFPCSLCSCSYFHKRHLDYHMRKHTNERRYECKICLQTFLYSDALKWHQIRSHNDKAPFNCSLCTRVFIHKKV